ncbi:MAG: triose-phosphate isomerase [Bacteroidetes bacterium HGW-Bacteroidetes-4]|jgi:triosephosphate isomerase|nr:MAG: triose-phosphate isomerase [Bacteroidetes bacterium HGW-Bacteroidetes-4]
MRQKIVAGNWKMNTTYQEGIDLAIAIDKAVAEKGDKNVQVVVAPPFTHIAEINKVVNNERISVAGQNCATETSGAYTGEVSAEMLWSAGADFVILGHSERRSYYGETNDMLKIKVKKALEFNLTPIYCVGEVLEEREANKHFDVIKKQLETVLFDLSDEEYKQIVIAYEPVWAIGTGKTASPAQAQEVHKFIRDLLVAKFGETAKNTSILYGGSCKPSNAKELFANPDVDGGLIGGASLTADDFLGIINGF